MFGKLEEGTEGGDGTAIEVIFPDKKVARTAALRECEYKPTRNAYKAGNVVACIFRWLLEKTRAEMTLDRGLL